MPHLLHKAQQMRFFIGGMRLFTFTFDFTEQDYIDYNIFYTHHMRRNRLEKYLRYGLPVLPILYLFLNSFLEGNDFDPISIGITILIFLSIYMFITRKKSYDKLIAMNVKKYIRGKGKDHLFGMRTMTFDENDFLARTEYEEIKTKYTKLTEIKDAEHGIHLFTAPMIAVILPNRIFSSAEEKSRFLEFIQSKIQQTG